MDVLLRGSQVLTYKQGDSFGELALMYNAPRQASVVSKDECHLWALDRLTFKVLCVLSFRQSAMNVSWGLAGDFDGHNHVKTKALRRILEQSRLFFFATHVSPSGHGWTS